MRQRMARCSGSTRNYGPARIVQQHCHEPLYDLYMEKGKGRILWVHIALCQGTAVQSDLLAYSPAAIFMEVEEGAKQHGKRGLERQEAGIHAARKLLKA